MQVICELHKISLNKMIEDKIEEFRIDIRTAPSQLYYEMLRCMIICKLCFMQLVKVLNMLQCLMSQNLVKHTVGT
jgi:hypothetical protein